MKRIFRTIAILLFITSFGVGCKTDSAKVKYTKPSKVRKVPKFNANNAYNFVQKQVDFGYRFTGTPAHRKTVDYLSEELSKYADNVIEQDFKVSFMDVVDANATNIIAVFNPNIDKRILLCAHYDTRMIAEKDTVENNQKNPILGADDGGSGVGVLLEIARLIKENGIDVGVDIVLFDAEDNGLDGDNWCLGSKYWSKNPHEKKYTAEFGILLDMVGAKGATFGYEGNSLYMAKSYLDKIWKMAKVVGQEDFFKVYDAGGIEDDHVHVFTGLRIPTVDIIYTRNVKEGDRFGTHHHTHADNMDIIDEKTLNAVGKTVTAVLYNFSNGRF